MHTDEATASHLLPAAITIMGSGRLGPTLTALIGLAATVIGGRALARARRRSRSDTDAVAPGGRNGDVAALALGAISLVLGGLFLAAADGGPGTGNGVVGSFVAIVLGPTAMVLGGLARARRRETGSIPPVQLASSAAGAPGDLGPKAP